MKTITILLIFLLSACNNVSEKPAEEVVTVEFYLGSWALDLDYDSNKAGWLEVRQEENYLDADLLWRWGSVNPVEFVSVIENQLKISLGRDIIRTKDQDGTPLRVHHISESFKIKKTGENSISGIAYFPGNNGIDLEKVSFTGKRIPDPGSAPSLEDIKFGDAIQLLNNDDLSGWKLLEDKAVNGWKVIDGVLINDPIQKEGEKHINYGNLRTEDTFEDFNLKLEVNIPEGSNSGVYLRGIYEIQVYDSYGKELDSHNMGALYSRITPSIAAEKPAGEWQELDITLYKRHLSVKLNGVTIINNQAVKGVTGGAMTSDEFVPGPIYLQGDHGKVSYRNIVIRPIV